MFLMGCRPSEARACIPRGGESNSGNMRPTEHFPFGVRLGEESSLVEGLPSGSVLGSAQNWNRDRFVRRKR